VNYVERTRFPWQRLDEDIELLELKVGGDWATMSPERSTKPSKKKGQLGTNRGNIGPISTAVTWASGKFSALSIALSYPNGSTLRMRTSRQRGRERTIPQSQPCNIRGAH
jgi:hypothetical protein